MPASDAHRIAACSPRLCASSSWARIIPVRTPRLRCVGMTPTTAAPAAATRPPGTVSWNVNAPAPPTAFSPSKAACRRPGSRKRSTDWARSSVGSLPPYSQIGRRAERSSAGSAGRTSRLMGSHLLERGVVQHQPPLAAVAGEADGDDPIGLDARDDALPEGRVAYVVARGEIDRRTLCHDPAGDRRPCRGAQLLALDLVSRELVEEAARQPVVACAPERARRCVREHEPLLRASEAHVCQAALLLEPLLLEGARVREDALLHPHEEDGAELEPLRVVEGHERHEAALLLQLVLVRVERDLLEELREAWLGCGSLVLAGDADELHEILDPPLRLDGPLRLERLEVTAALEDALQELRDGQLERPRHERLHQRAQALDRLERRRAHARLLRLGERLPEGDPLRVRVGLEARERGVADPAPRPVGDACERDRIVRVVDRLEVSDGVLDFCALVEARPADHLVGDLHAHGLALAELAPEVLRLALAIVGDDGVGRAQDRVGGAVVLLERDRAGAPEVALELEDVADVRAPEGVDGLVRVADGEDVPVLPGEELEEPVLGVVRVLILVHEDVAEGLLPALARVGEALEHL